MKFEKDPKWKFALSFGELKHYKDDIYYNVENEGTKRYWKDGWLHRDDGPAIEYKNGRKYWYIEQKEYTEEEHKEKIKMMEMEKDSKWKKVLMLGELKHYKDDIYYNIDKLGYKYYWRDGLIHRDDGPAVEYKTVNTWYKAWFKEDKYHRLDGPAVEWSDGCKFWYKEGKYHRLDGPALEYPDGIKFWYIEGKQYTENKFNEKLKLDELKKDPKYKHMSKFGKLKYYKNNIFYNIDKNHTKRYWKKGSLHREDGPALEYSNGFKEWWIENKKISEEEFNNMFVLFYKKTTKFCDLFENFTSTYNPQKNTLLLTCDNLSITIDALNDSILYIENPVSKVWFNKGKISRKDGPAIEHNNGSKEWYINGLLHREDGPAIELSTDYKEWWKKGKKHREDGPAVEHTNGDKEWWKNGELHRDDGPAIDADLQKSWYKKGKLHRTDGPAYEGKNGLKEWWVDGQLHRLDGPAIIYENGGKAWYINNICIKDQTIKPLFKKPIELSVIQSDNNNKNDDENSFSLPLGIIAACGLAKTLISKNNTSKITDKIIINSENKHEI